MPIPIKAVSQIKVVKQVKELLLALGYDLTHPDLRATPKRVAKALIQEGAPDIKKLFQVFPSKHTSMVVVKNHETWTRCPHHMERVRLTVSIAYIPDGRLLGLSKLARIADYYSSGLMLQEEIADNIVEGLMEALKPKGIACFIRGFHMCMRARGIKSSNVEVLTSTVRGIFQEDPKAREEFLFHINN